MFIQIIFRKVSFFLFLIIVLSFVGYSYDKQNNVNFDNKIDGFLKMLRSEVWPERSKAVYKISLKEEYYTNKLIQNELISLLEREESEKHDSKTKTWKTESEFTDGESDYLFTLVNLVSRIDNEYAFEIIKKTQFSDALVNFGEKGIKEVIRLLIEEKQLGAIWALEKVIEQNKIDSELRKKIKILLIQTLQNPQIQHPNREDFKSEEKYYTHAMWNSGVRKTLITSLSKFGDKDIISIIEKYAQTDPFLQKSKNEEEIYPVREEAKKALEKIHYKK